MPEIVYILATLPRETGRYRTTCACGGEVTVCVSRVYMTTGYDRFAYRTAMCRKCGIIKSAMLR